MEKVSTKTKNTKGLSVAFIVFMIIIIVSMAALIAVLYLSLDKTLYAERSSHMIELTEKSSDVVGEVIETSYAYTDILAHLCERDIGADEDVHTFLNRAITEFPLQDSIYIVVDENTNYYTSDGRSGKITQTDYYLKTTEDRLIYLSDSFLNGQQDSMVFRERLDTDKTITCKLDSTATVNLKYCCVVRNMNFILDKMKNSSYEECNSFICSIEDGTMLYRHLSYGLLISGWNFYNKYNNSNLVVLHDLTASELVQEIKEGKETVCECNIDGTRYFISTSPIRETGYFYALIIKTSSFGSNTVDYESGVFAYIIGIVVCAAMALVVAVLFLLRINSNKKLIAKEQEANVYLTKAAHAAETASKSKSDFLANMSHDIRTPINGVLGMTEIALKTPDNPIKTVDCLNKIKGASKHLLSLVNDVLDMAKIESGDVAIARDPMDLVETIDNCIAIIKGQVEGKDINIVSEIEALKDARYVIGDELHLRQAFINILGNAAKFTPEGGSITLKAMEIAKDTTFVSYSFEFIDTGCGMSEEYQKKVFDPFTQEANSSRTQYKGTGLGMAITKKFITKMGGTISVASEQGKGTTFTVVLPFELDKNHKEDVVEEDTLDVKGVKVLLVEDNELNMEIAKTLLEENGIIVDTAMDGLQAVDKFENAELDKYDAIFMDVMMPNMNGLDATRKIRSSSKENANTIPIIAMTANAYDDDIKATLDAGMNAHISKPIEMDIVLKTLYSFTRKKH